MKSIIRQLYYGNLCPADRIYPADPDYKRVWDQIIEKTQHLTEKLPAENAGSVEELEELYCAMAAMDTYAGFAYGLRLGFGLAGEVACDLPLGEGGTAKP